VLFKRHLAKIRPDDVWFQSEPITMIRSFPAPFGCRDRALSGAAGPLVAAIVGCLCGLLLLGDQGTGRAQAGPSSSKPLAPPVVHSETPGLGEPGPRNVGDLRAIQTRVEAIADHVRRCTVGLVVGDAQGSGVIVSETGLVLTAAHVVMAPGRKVTVVLSDGKHLEGHSLGVNSGTDCGAVQITEGGPFPACKLSDMRSLHVGDWCLATGHPGGYQEGRAPVVRLGRIVEFLAGMVQTDCPLLGGDSGGPLFDLNGNVIGINSRIGARTILNLHVPITLFLRDWDRLTTVAAPHWGDAESAGVIGIDGRDDPKGARITQVFPRSPADRAGLQLGDVVTTFDGKSVAGFKGLQKLIAAHHPGDVVALSILRDQAVQQVHATITARPRE
jgi:serine protease Do